MCALALTYMCTLVWCVVANRLVPELPFGILCVILLVQVGVPRMSFFKFQMKIAVVCCCFLYCIVFLHLYGARHKALNLALTLYVPELLLFVVSC